MANNYTVTVLKTHDTSRNMRIMRVMEFPDIEISVPRAFLYQIGLYPELLK